jgi:hypothetical protein
MVAGPHAVWNPRIRGGLLLIRRKEPDRRGARGASLRPCHSVSSGLSRRRRAAKGLRSSHCFAVFTARHDGAPAPVCNSPVHPGLHTDMGLYRVEYTNATIHILDQNDAEGSFDPSLFFTGIFAVDQASHKISPALFPVPPWISVEPVDQISDRQIYRHRNERHADHCPHQVSFIPHFALPLRWGENFGPTNAVFEIWFRLAALPPATTNQRGRCGREGGQNPPLTHLTIISMEIIKWLVTSSADPQKYSLMVKRRPQHGRRVSHSALAYRLRPCTDLLERRPEPRHERGRYGRQHRLPSVLDHRGLPVPLRPRPEDVAQPLERIPNASTKLVTRCATSCAHKLPICNLSRGTAGHKFFLSPPNRRPPGDGKKPRSVGLPGRGFPFLTQLEQNL